MFIGHGHQSKFEVTVENAGAPLPSGLRPFDVGLGVLSVQTI